MVCELSHSTTKGLSIGALAASAVALCLGIGAVVAKRKGTNTTSKGKCLLAFGSLFYLATFALILAAGFAIYGRSVAKCQKKRDKKRNKLLDSNHHHHDDDYDNSTDHIVYTAIALVFFLIIGVIVCARSNEGCLFFGLFMLLS
jgi:hypothetical protein